MSLLSASDSGALCLVKAAGRSLKSRQKDHSRLDKLSFYSFESSYLEELHVLYVSNTSDEYTTFRDLVGIDMQKTKAIRISVQGKFKNYMRLVQ